MAYKMKKGDKVIGTDKLFKDLIEQRDLRSWCRKCNAECAIDLRFPFKVAVVGNLSVFIIINGCGKGFVVNKCDLKLLNYKWKKL